MEKKKKSIFLTSSKICKRELHSIVSLCESEVNYLCMWCVRVQINLQFQKVKVRKYQ
jgi:hypothetical protein